MKKTAFIAGAALFFCVATASAQTDSIPTEPAKTRTDQWNNFPPEKYKLLPMPEALTTEKIFPVLGKYTMTDKDGAAADVTIMLDESNKGIVWVEGLPQGRIKAYLRQSPGIYRIPVQKVDEKSIPEGVLVFDKDANTLNVCIGCAYNNEDPAGVFAVATEPAPEEIETKTKVKKGVVKTKTKAKAKTWKYSGNKVVETTASVVPMQ